MSENELKAREIEAAFEAANPTTGELTGLEIDAAFDGNYFKTDGDEIKISLNEKSSRLPDKGKTANSPYTIKEAAVELLMSPQSVRRQIDRGHLRKCKVFGRVLIPRKDVDTFFEKYSEYSFVH